MKKKYVSILLLLISFSSFSQEKIVAYSDSLLKLLSSTKEDVHKIELLSLLTLNAIQNEHWDAAIRYANKMLSLSEKNQQHESIIKSNAFLGNAYYKKNDAEKSLLYLEKSLDTINIHLDDSTRLMLYSSLQNIYFTKKDFSKSIQFGLQTAKLREGQKNYEMAITMSKLGDSYVHVNNNYFSAKNYWLKSLALRNELPDSSVINLLHNLGLLYRILGDYPAAIKSYNDKIDIAQKTGNKKAEASGLRNLGNAYSEKGDFIHAEEAFLKSLEMYKKSNSTYEIAVLQNNIANNYTLQGKYKEALEHMLNSLKLAEEVKNDELIATDLNDITVIFKGNGEYREGLNYLFNAKAIFERTANTKMLPAVLGNIAALYTILGKKDSAIFYNQESLKLTEQLNDSIYFKREKATALTNMNFITLDTNNISNTLSHSNEAIILSTQLSDSMLIITNLVIIAKNCLRLATDSSGKTKPGDVKQLSKDSLLKQSMNYLIISADYCEKHSNKDLLQEVYLLLSQALEAHADFKSAISVYKKHIEVRNEVYNVENAKAITKQIDKYNSDKEKAVAEEIHKAKFRIWSIVAAALFIITITCFYFYRKIENNRLNLRITALRQEALNAQMSDHFIGNTMDTINGFIQTNDKDKASEYLHKFSRLIRKVLENATEKLIPLNDDLHVLKDYIELEKLRFPEGFDYTILVDDKIDAPHTLVPPMIFQILAENAIKHGFRKTATGNSLLLKIMKKEDKIECTVEDNGIGYQPSVNKERISKGQGIAQELIQAVSKAGTKSSYNITNRFNENDSPVGTIIVFTLPYIVAT